MDIPYLEPAEECEEVAFDECVEVEEKIPVELCTRRRVDETTFALERGKTFRKEGEKRRRRIGTRRPQEQSQKGEEEEEVVRGEKLGEEDSDGELGEEGMEEEL